MASSSGTRSGERARAVGYTSPDDDAFSLLHQSADTTALGGARLDRLPSTHLFAHQRYPLCPLLLRGASLGASKCC